MLLLEPNNKVLAETISAQLKPLELIENDDGKQEKAKREPIDVRLCDFDDVLYHVLVSHDARDTLMLSVYLPCWNEIKDRGGLDALKEHYGDFISSSKEDGYDVTLTVNLDNPPMKPEDLVLKLSSIKSVLVGGIFDRYFSGLLSAKPVTENFTFKLKGDTQIFMVPRAERVIIVYSLQFNDKVDAAIAKVFMQEFVDARRRITSAPPCTFSVNPPLELKEFGIVEPIPGNLGFVSFAVEKRNVEGVRKEKVVFVLQSFRNYIQYHIKCSKAFFHSRMRARVVSLIKVLNRAKQDVPAGQKEMKTIQGKTFKRDV